MKIKIKFTICLLVVCSLLLAQQLSIDEAVAVAMTNHPVARNIVLAQQNDELMQRSRHHRILASTRQAERILALDKLAWQVKSAYMEVVYFRRRLQIIQEHNYYFEALISVAEIHLAADSITELERVSAGTCYAIYQSRMYIAEEEVKRAESLLCQLLYLPVGTVEPSETDLELYQIHSEKPANERFEPVKYKGVDEAQLREAQSLVKLEKRKLFSQRARIKQAETGVKMKANEIEYRQFVAMQHVETLQSLLDEYFVQLSLSKENMLVEARLTLQEVEKDFAAGRITNYADVFTKVSNAVSAKLNHLEFMNLYNQTALELEFCTQ